jgi:hypothetical protein
MGPLYPVEHLGPPTEVVDLWNHGEYSDVELAVERILDFIAVFGFCSKRYAWLLNICHTSETEKMLQLQKQLSVSLEQNKKPELFQTLVYQDFQSHDSLNVIRNKSFMGLNSMDIVATDKTTDLLLTDKFDSIISTDANFWTNVWAEVAARQASLLKLEVRHDEVNKRKYSHGVGSAEAAEHMDKVLEDLGSGLRAGRWRVRQS